jgi:hypothetical protein
VGGHIQENRTGELLLVNVLVDSLNKVQLKHCAKSASEHEQLDTQQTALVYLSSDPSEQDVLDELVSSVKLTAAWGPLPVSLRLAHERASMPVGSPTSGGLRYTFLEKLYRALWWISEDPVRNAVRARILSNLESLDVLSDLRRAG